MNIGLQGGELRRATKIGVHHIMEIELPAIAGGASG
jgi:hypothetical protein